MRKFKCYQCNHTWELPFGEGGRGVEQACPKCKSNNIHRVGKTRGQGQGNRGRWNRGQGGVADLGPAQKEPENQS